MTNSKGLKRTFSHAIKSSSGDCELRETYKSPVLWLQFLPPAQNDLGHRVIGILGKLRHVGKPMSGWAIGQTAYCMVVWLHLLGQLRLLKTLNSAFGSLLALRYRAWTRQGWRSSSHPLGCRASVQEKIPGLPPFLQQYEQLQGVESWTGHLLAVLCSWECQPVGTSCSSGCVEEFSWQTGVWRECDREIQGQDMACIATKTQGMSCQQG